MLRGMIRWVGLGALLILLIPGAAWGAEGSFRIGGDLLKPGEWTAARVAAELSESVQTIRFEMKGTARSARGVPLWSLIDAAGPRIDPAKKNHRVAFVVVLRARDGYLASFSLAELAPDIGNRKVWLVWEMDGKPLPEAEGPVRLVVPEEGGGHHRRWIFGVTEIRVLDGAALGGRGARS